MSSIKHKLVLDVSATGYMPPINIGLPLTSTSEERSDPNVQRVNIKSASKHDAKSTVSRSIFGVKDHSIKPKTLIHYIFSRPNARSNVNPHASDAPGVGVEPRATDARLQPVSPRRTGIREQVASTTGAGVITLGSSLSSNRHMDGISVSISQPHIRNMANTLRSFSFSPAHFNTEAHENYQQLSIEGVRTGEKSVIEISESHKKKDSITQNFSSSNQEEEQRRRFCKIRGECRNLTDQLQKKKMKIQRMCAIFALCIEASERRSQIEWDYWVERDKYSHSILEKVHQTSHLTSLQLKANYTSHVNELQKEVQRLRRELESFKSIRDELKMQEVQIRADKSAENEILKQEIEQMKCKMEEQRARFAHEKEQLGVEIVESQDAQRRLAEQLRDVKNELAEESFMIQQCRIFLKQICQPSFHVVKGVSLEPVEPNRPEPTGFVMIPLVILLHGYSLLPVKEREDVIRQYEHKSAEQDGQ
ncbi:unnamed protein product [Phytomonas sp. Hart1]|nr:unnamed protein product [Phytomonas sp. Hart1]|eukprot:CCW66964.1 unnamed protein product [Phytomonas sp. isolate Hart1]